MRGFGGMGGGGSGGSSGSCTEQMKAGWSKIPLFNKFILSTCCFIYLSSFLVIYVLTLTMLRPLDMLHFQVWKLITGPFAHGQLLNLLFSLLSYVPSAVYEEEDMGTVPFTIRFFKLSFFINVVFCAVAFLVGFTIMPAAMLSPCMGLWPILFCDLVIQCYKDPEMPRGLCCLPIQIKSKWYPLVLYGIFTLVFMNVDLSFTTGLGVGYLYTFGYLKCLETSAQSVSAWEKRWPFSRYKDDASFRQSNTAAVNPPQSAAPTQASTGSSGGLTSFFGGGSQSGTTTEAPRGNAPQPAAAQPSSFNAFSGKGFSLGGADIESTKSSSSMMSNFLGSGNKSTSTSAPEPQEAPTRSSAPAQARDDKREGDPSAATDPDRSIDEDDYESSFLQKKSKDDKGAYQQVDHDNL